jgi:hypothetical protein
MPLAFRRYLGIFATALLLVQPSLAFKTPLSEQAVREAYFLGQRHDGTYPRLLGKYTKFLPRPKTGPYISSVALYTPFLQMVAYSDGYIGNYSAQQAQIDYRKKGEETVQVSVLIELTDSYGQFVPISANAASRSPAFVPRPHDFWKEFKVQVYNNEGQLSPSASRGHANSNCSRGGCALVGATIELEFPATAFASESTTIEVDPPEGDRVSVKFDLSSIR